MPDYLVQEDGTKIILEDGTGSIILEENPNQEASVLMYI